MLKKTLTFCLIFVAFAISGQAQTFKVTDVNSRDSRLEKQSNELLGKNLSIEVFDKSLKLFLPSAKPIILKQYGDDKYYGVIEDNGTESWTADIILKTTFNITTSVILTIAVNGGKTLTTRRSSECYITAKRF